MSRLRHHEGVECSLAAKAVQPFLGVQIVKIDGEVQGLDLVDPDGPSIVKDHAVGAARDLHRPAVDLDLDLGRDLAPETGLRGFHVSLNASVELGADPEPGETGPGEPDRTLGGLAEDIPDPGTDPPPLEVDRDRHDRRRRRSWWRTRVIAISAAAP